MPSLSATVVQKAYKVEATTIYARVSLNAAGTTATLITGSVAGGNPGASKGVSSVAYAATGLYTLTLDPSIPVQQFLGAPSVIIKNGNVTGTDPTFLTRIYSATSGSSTGATLTIVGAAATAAATPAAITSSAGCELWVTIPFTTSNVW